MEKEFLEFLNNKENHNNILLEQAFCHKPTGCYLAKLKLGVSAKNPLPYLKPQVKTLLYEPEVQLVFKFSHQGKFYKIFLKEYELKWGIVSNLEEAKEVLNCLIGYFEELLQRKNEITPDYTPLKRPSALEIYKILPKTNCGECGEASCLALAVRISMAEAELSQCPYLSEGYSS